MTLLAYHNDPALKTSVLAQMGAHRAADDLVQGCYWERGKGCAVGCLTHKSDGGHALYPKRWGIPVVLAHLEDRIFEGLSAEDARAWPERFLSAIPVGADLSLVWPRFALALLTDETHGVRRLAPEGSDARKAINAVAALFTRQIAGNVPTRGEWRFAADAAAAHTYAVDAAAAAHTYAAAADAAASAAADAAASAAAHAHAHAERHVAYRWQADTLAKLLADAPGSSAIHPQAPRDGVG
jgi:hypothetical protein